MQQREPTTVVEVSDRPLIRVELEYDRRVSYAMQQSAVPIVRLLRVVSQADRALEGLVLRLTTSPAVAAPFEMHIARLDAGATWNIGTLEDAIELPLRRDALLAMIERELGHIAVQVSQGGELLCSVERPLEVLAHNEWSGVTSLPEILAAFVQPNHPALVALLAATRDALADATGEGTLGGYRGQPPDRIRAIVEALYQTTEGLGLTYTMPPASFEQSGQKIRTPDEMLTARMGTCLDLSVLFAAACEQLGLNPLIVIIKGHAFPGVWLTDGRFPEGFTDEPSELRERVALGEMLLFEATAVTRSAGQTTTFQRAVDAANRHLADEDRSGPEIHFHYAVDVAGARIRGIRPLPARGQADGGDARPDDPLSSEPDAHRAPESASRPSDDHDDGRPGHGGDAGPQAPSSTPRALVPNSDAPPAPEARPQSPHNDVDPAGPIDDIDGQPDREGLPDRIERWKERLLDLSLRNRLLNHRVTARVIPLSVPSLSGLEDGLAAGRAFRVKPAPSLMTGRDPRNAELHRAQSGEDAVATFLDAELARGILHADLDPPTLDRRLVNVYRGARQSIEETGANMLFLAMGFLAWYEADRAKAQRRAPLLLVPVQLERRSVREGFVLRMTDDEPFLNHTLVHKLAVDYGLQVSGIDPGHALPEDESGVDLARVLDAFRRAVLPMKRWEVREEVHLGFFSFTKFVMWRDLDAIAERISSAAGGSCDGSSNAYGSMSDVVFHLTYHGGEVYPRSESLAGPDTLDGDRHPLETWCPLDADASQLAAIHAAADGHSFVLEGPPGTGKSQTITNLIAHSLAMGRSVLFISEKMAALDVVRRRLEQVGLGPYCLELHSTKTHKRNVVEQLRQALAHSGATMPAAWEGTAGKLAEARDVLNSYVSALHAPRTAGRSVRQATAELVELREAMPDAPPVGIDRELVRDLDASHLDQLHEAVERIADGGRLVGRAVDHPWAAVQRRTGDPNLTRDAEQVADRVGRAAEAVVTAWGGLDAIVELGIPRPSFEVLTALDQLAARLKLGVAVPAGLLETTAWAETRDEIEVWIGYGERRDILRADLEPHYALAPLLQSDLDRLYRQFERWTGVFVLLAWLMLFWTRWKLRAVARHALPPNSEIAADLGTARELRACEAFLNDASTRAQPVLGATWREGEADWIVVRDTVEHVAELRALAAQLSGDDLERASALRKRLAVVTAEGAEGVADDRPIGRALQTYHDAWAELVAARAQADALLDVDANRAWGAPQDADYLARVASTVEGWQASGSELRHWLAWNRTCHDARTAGLAPVVETFSRGEVTLEQLNPAFERALWSTWLDHTSAEAPLLRDFHGHEHNHRIRRFRALDEGLLAMTSQAVVARVATRAPDGTVEGAKTSELGILQREIRKRSRYLSVRRLFERLPTLLRRLKPCVLMSPLSVAQFLDPYGPSFDLVVFDEASQIPPWDAIGAMARGRNVVVVGDAKQLPPTRFFAKGEEEAGLGPNAGVGQGPQTEHHLEELESILDECVASGLPRLYLQWHYRSRHDGLIAFSNYHYYGNRLSVFPPAQRRSPNLGVSLVHVADGVYDKGESRTNRAEAEAVVARVVQRLIEAKGEGTEASSSMASMASVASVASMASMPSLGIVTFSVAQQSLIEDLLDEARQAHPEIEPAFGDDRPEPVFVKNLENVQGDERDVILFSVCYGPDSAGRVSMNFGPLNRAGGERRLNVAITRARLQVVVFSSLRPEQIDLSRTQAIGARHLRTFLEYAGAGPAAIAEAVALDPQVAATSSLERSIQRALEARGWIVHSQVGVSKHRIDLAVVDPHDSDRYLLGIECDGPSYAAVRTARDRDRLRHSVLLGLGWRMERVWSADWLNDPDHEIDRLEAALADADEARAASTSPETPASGRPTAPIDAEPSETDAAPSSPDPSITAQSGDVCPYVRFDIPSPIGTPAELYTRRHAKRSADLLGRIIAAEGPMSVSLAARRLAAAHGMDRLTTKARRLVVELCPKIEPAPLIREDFIWPAALEPRTWRGHRTWEGPEGSPPPRLVDDIAIEELANAAEAVIRQQLGLPIEDLARELAHRLGFTRLAPKIRGRAMLGIERLLAEGRGIDDEGQIRLPPSS